MTASLHNELKDENIHINVLSLRRALKLSQSAFIENYLKDGERSMSLSKYSNFERNGGKDSLHIAELVCQRVKLDISVFMMSPDGFVPYIDDFFKQPCDKMSFHNPDSIKNQDSPVSQLVRIISDYISDCLASGELKTGDKLPSDRDFSAMFSVGRTAVREALKVLSVLGLIDIRPGQGTFICKNSSNFFLMPLSWGFYMGEHNIYHIIDVRNVLEVESAQLAAKHWTQEELELLTDTFNRSSEAYYNGNFKDFLDLDMDFHLAIANCSKNPIISSLLFTSRNLIRQISKSGMATVEHLKNIYVEHGIIYNAICERDAYGASQKMLAHLINSCARYSINK